MASNNVVIRFDDDDEDYENIPKKEVSKAKPKAVEIEMKDVEEIVVEKGDSEAVAPEELIEPLQYLQKLGVPSNYLYYVNQRKNMFFLAIGIILLIIFIAIFAVAVYVYLNYFASTEAFDYEGNHYNSTTYLTTAIQIPPGQIWSSFISNLEHPDGETAIHAISISLVDEFGDALPIEQIYPIDLTISIDSVPIGTTQGGNSILFRLPIPYAIHSSFDSRWELSGHIANLFGFITDTPTSVKAQYTVIYSPLDQNTTKIVNYYVFGSYPLPTTTVQVGGDNTVTFDYEWSGNTKAIIEANPLVSIGALNSTLTLKGANSTVIASSSMSYTDSGYITDVEISYPDYTLSSGSTVSVTTVYDNSISLPNVISAYGFYGESISDSII